MYMLTRRLMIQTYINYNDLNGEFVNIQKLLISMTKIAKKMESRTIYECN
jgi:hypothetical protein